MTWLILIGMTLAVMAALLVPVFGRRDEIRDRAGYDRAVFRDQLSELERDRERGVIGVAEADAARNEISRRLLQAAPPCLAALFNAMYRSPQCADDSRDCAISCC